jgi:membrane protease YdiL (CAAX protease family)
VRARRSCRLRRQASFAIAYFAVYFVYLLIHQESELEHWLSLVIVPVAGLWWFYARRRTGRGLRATLASIGLSPSHASRGLGAALIVGLAVQGVQLMNGRQRGALFELFASGDVVWLAPLAFVLLVGTAATTEEVLFRGILQTRLTALFRSSLLGLIAAAFLFGLFHFPYALLDPGWPSMGDPVRALQLAMANGVFGGLVAGAVFIRARGNLLAPILVHAFVNIIPAMLSLESLLAG